jgi:Cd2+/Zn2+-exporting ATPase
VATNLESLTGKGLRAEVDGQVVYIGKRALFAEIDAIRLPPDLDARMRQLESDGRTTFAVKHGDRYLGAIGLMDTPRAAATAVIAQLRALGIRQMVMLSGDNQQVADAVAKSVGIDRALGNLMPEDKVTTIRELQAAGDVAMIGDGVNDAPALASASVGIAMGAAGSDVALETADVALMGDDLSKLPFVIGLSRQTRRIIRQNLWASLGMVAILIPATIFGLKMGVAVLFHEGSTLLVVANALRLLAYREPQA